jgi:hypothetical protein
MKIVELLNKIQVPINNEEADLLGRFEVEEHISKHKLSEREQLLAHRLTTQDILLRKLKENGEIIYSKKIK